MRTCSKETSDMSVDCEDMARPAASYKPYVVPILSSIICCFSCVTGVSISIHCSLCPSIVIDGMIQLLGDFQIRLQGLRPSDHLCLYGDALSPHFKQEGKIHIDNGEITSHKSSGFTFLRVYDIGRHCLNGKKAIFG